MDVRRGTLSFLAAMAKSVTQSVMLFIVLAQENGTQILRRGSSRLRLVEVSWAVYINIAKC